MKLILELSNRNLTFLDSKDEEDTILKQNLEISVSIDIKISTFVFPHPRRIKRTEPGAIMFGRWVDVTSGFIPDSPKRGRATFKARLWKGIKTRRFNQNQKFFPQNYFDDQVHLHKPKKN